MPVVHKGSVLALDIGTKRTGIALASLEVKLARPYSTLINDDNFVAQLQEIIAKENVTQIVIGLPRGLNGQATQQTGYVEDYARMLSRHVSLPVTFQDEAVTSKQAEAELQARGKMYTKGDIDALAATYILEDFLRDNERTPI